MERRGRDGDGRQVCLYPTNDAVAMQAALNEASGAVTSTLKRSLSLRPMQLQLAARLGF